MTTMQYLQHSASAALPGEIDLVWKATILLLVATAVMGGLRWRSAASRHLVWSLTMISLLLLPVLVCVLPQWAILPSAVNPVPAGNVIIAPVTAPHADHPLAVGILLLWLAGAIVMLARVIGGSLAIRSLPTNEAADESLQQELHNAAENLGINRKIALRISPGRVMPMTWGTIQPTILLPADTKEWPAHRRRLVLLHELAHVRRLDCLTHLLASIARATFWFHPLAWFALHRMKIEREKACDDLVLRQGVRPSVYADELLLLSTQCDRFIGFGAAIAIARSTRLESRVSSILREDPDRRSLSRFSLAMAVGVAFTAVPCLAMLSRASQMTPPPVAEKRAINAGSASASLIVQPANPTAAVPVLVEDDSLAAIRQQMRSGQLGMPSNQQIAPSQEPQAARPGLGISWGYRQPPFSARAR